MSFERIPVLMFLKRRGEIEKETPQELNFTVWNSLLIFLYSGNRLVQGFCGPWTAVLTG